MGIKWLKAKEAAQYLRIHVITLYRLMHTGKLPHFKIGGTYRVPVHSLEKIEEDSWV